MSRSPSPKALAAISFIAVAVMVSIGFYRSTHPQRITREQAIECAHRYLRENKPTLVILGVRSASPFESDLWQKSKPEKYWTVSFEVPAPPSYSRKTLSHLVMVDSQGHVPLPSVTTSP